MLDEAIEKMQSTRSVQESVQTSCRIAVLLLRPTGPLLTIVGAE